MGELENGKKDRRIIVEEISRDCKSFGVEDRYRNGCCGNRRWACGNIDSIFSGAGRTKVYRTGGGSYRQWTDCKYNGEGDFAAWIVV